MEQVEQQQLEAEQLEKGREKEAQNALTANLRASPPPVRVSLGFGLNSTLSMLCPLKLSCVKSV